MKSWLMGIKRLKACKEAIEWGEQFDAPGKAWQECERGEGMLWLLGKLSGKPGSDSRKKLVLAACGCARLSLPYVPKGEIRSLRAIETAEAWARGDAGITLQMVKAAAYAAYAAYYAAYAADAYAADDAASYAAYAAYAAAADAYAADDAASYADYAAYYAAYAAARKATLKKCADIVRQHYPEAPEVK